MQPYSSILVFFVISLFLVRRWIPFRYSIPIFAVKFGLLFLNMRFENLFLPYHTRPGDSFTYYTMASQLITEGHSPVSLLVAGLEPISQLSGSSHPLYWFWNVLWITVFGDSIFSPMVANVFILVVGSVVTTVLLAELDYSYQFQQWFLAFSLVQWEILVWPAMMNLKDPLVATLTIILLYCVVVVIRREGRFRILAIAVAFFISFVFYYIRFYVPGLVGATIGLWSMVEMVRRSQWQYISYLSAGGLLTLELLRRRGLPKVRELVELTNLPAGLIRFPLTPTPWDTSRWYSFLMIPSALHWLAMPAAMVGSLLFTRKRIERLLVCYLLVIVCFYAVVPEFLGPRHRFQAIFVIALVQFYGLWTLITRRYKFVVRS